MGSWEEKEVEKLFASIDCLENDQAVSFEEWKAMMKSQVSLTLHLNVLCQADANLNRFAEIQCEAIGSHSCIRNI